MKIRVIRTELLTQWTERWWIALPRADFRRFGFCLEALEGVGLHRQSREAEDVMEVDVAVGFKPSWKLCWLTWPPRPEPAALFVLDKPGPEKFMNRSCGV